MKRYIILSLCILCSMFVYSQSSSECFGYIKKYDVPKGYMTLPKTDNSAFWLKRKDYDSRLQKVFAQMESDTKPARKAKETIFWKNIEAGKVFKSLPTLNEDYKEILDSLEKVFCFKKIDYSIKLLVIPSNEFNAAACPDGTILIYKGLIDNLSFNELVGVLAHELNHYVNKHSQQRLYAVAKKEQTNKFWAGFGAAMTGVAASVNAYYSGMAGQSQETINKTTQNFTKLIDDIYDTSEKATVNFRFRYSREAEIESDIAAYRFLQFIGKDPGYYFDVLNFIIRLEGGETETNKHDDHPTGVLRKKILESIKDYDLKYKDKYTPKKLKEKKKVAIAHDDMY